MTVRVFCYARCGTCKKALKWLADQGVDHSVIPITEKPPSLTLLRKLFTRSGLPIRRFFNTSGGSYREGNWSKRLATVSTDEALEALAADPMLIKRPLVDGGEFVLVGFDEKAWQAVFSLAS